MLISSGARSLSALLAAGVFAAGLACAQSPAVNTQEADLAKQQQARQIVHCEQSPKRFSFFQSVCRRPLFA